MYFFLDSIYKWYDICLFLPDLFYLVWQSVHPFIYCKWQYFILFYGWVIFYCVCISSSVLLSHAQLCTHGLQPTRLLCPWDFPGKDTGVGCHFLLQGIFPTQGSNLGLLHCRQIIYWPSYQESPCVCIYVCKNICIHTTSSLSIHLLMDI